MRKIIGGLLVSGKICGQIDFQEEIWTYQILELDWVFWGHLIIVQMKMAKGKNGSVNLLFFSPHPASSPAQISGLVFK